MDNQLKQFIREAKDTKLSDQERSSVKNNVLNFVSNNPVRAGIQPHLGYGSNIFLTRLNFASTMAILLIFAVLVSGGVAVGAEKALPGEVLYRVKVNINEEVRGWMATSDEAKADWEIKRTERRLEEAEQLAGEGSLNLEASQNIEANFEANAQRVRERVEKFRNKENFNAAASVSLNFETALKAHDRILSRLSQKKSEAGVQVKPIRERIRSEVHESAQQRERIGAQSRGKTEINIREGDGGSAGSLRTKEDANSGIEIDSDIKSGDSSVKAENNLNVELGL